MAATRRTPPADPEFDRSPVRPARASDFFDPSLYQRVVVNPFLAVLGLIGLAWLAKALVASPWPATVGLLFVPFVLLPHLIQFHCLDCGQTEPYPRRSRHACPRVIDRHQSGQEPLFSYPTGWAQLVTWGWVLGALGLLLAIAVWT